jgi:hypothetical protein
MIVLNILVSIILILLFIGYIIAGVFVAIFFFDDKGNRFLKRFSWITLPIVTILWLPGTIILALWYIVENLIDSIIKKIINIK